LLPDNKVTRRVPKGLSLDRVHRAKGATSMSADCVHWRSYESPPSRISTGKLEGGEIRETPPAIRAVESHHSASRKEERAESAYTERIFIQSAVHPHQVCCKLSTHSDACRSPRGFKREV